MKLRRPMSALLPRADICNAPAHTIASPVIPGLPCCGIMVSCETKGRPIRLQAHSRRIWRGDRKPLNPAARERVCNKSGRAHVSECGVDEPKTVRAIKRYGNGLWHRVKVVVQHSQSANIARGTGEPLPTTSKSYDLSVFEPLDGIAQRVVHGG